MNKDRKLLISLRISLYRVAQQIGLKDEKPIEQITHEAEDDIGWNTLAASVRYQIHFMEEDNKLLRSQLISNVE